MDTFSIPSKKKRSSSASKRSSSARKRSFTKSQTKKTRRSQPSEQFKNAKATQLQYFFRKNKHKIRTLFLKTICTDSHVCIGFGQETDKIMTFFDNFTNFSMISEDSRQIGEESFNGSIIELTYSRDGYNANTVIKANKHAHANNLFYEGCVGFFLNKMGKRFSCFLQTYGLFFLTDLRVYNQIINNPIIPKNDLIQALQNNVMDVTYKTIINPEENILRNLVCTNYIRLFLLIEHMKDVKTFYQIILNDPFRKEELGQVLFQLYFPLKMLSDQFTHYDLHLNNVLIYEPVVGKYIEYNYHLLNNTTVSFISKYIVKIIDYGRCFFDDPSNHNITGNSRNLFYFFANQPSCQTEIKRSLKYLFREPTEEKHFVSSKIVNRSHDLRIIHNLQELQNYYGFSFPKELDQIFDKLIYNQTRGTPELPNGISDHKIQTCSDMCDELATYLQSKLFQNSNAAYSSHLQKIGTLHMYSDGREMVFSPAKK